MGSTHTNLDIVVTTIDGGSAGNHTVTGIKTTDKLKAVEHLSTSGAIGLDGGEDLTSEFSITAANTINNTGGTDTTNGVLIITYIAADPRGGDLNRS